MWTPTVILGLLIVWAVTFSIALLPAIWIGRLIVRKCLRTVEAATVCLACTKVLVVFVATFLIVMKFEALPHVRAEGQVFAIVFSAVVFGVPAFAALLLGWQRARKSSVGV